MRRLVAARHVWPWHWAAHEADGAIKYNGPDASRIVAAQNEREWSTPRGGLLAWRTAG